MSLVIQAQPLPTLVLIKARTGLRDECGGYGPSHRRGRQGRSRGRGGKVLGHKCTSVDNISIGYSALG